MAKQKKEQRLQFTIKVGPELMSIIEEQIKKIQEVTYGISHGSTWEAGEIIAKKYKGEV